MNEQDYDYLLREIETLHDLVETINGRIKHIEEKMTGEE